MSLFILPHRIAQTFCQHFFEPDLPEYMKIFPIFRVNLTNFQRGIERKLYFFTAQENVTIKKNRITCLNILIRKRNNSRVYGLLIVNRNPRVRIKTIVGQNVIAGISSARKDALHGFG